MNHGQLAMSYAMEDALASDTEFRDVAEEWFASRPVGARFTADDLRKHAGDGPMGAAFRAAQARGEIRFVGYIRTTRPSRRGNRNGLWERIDG